MELKLSPADRSALRARAHALDPVVMIGAEGLTPAVLKEVDVNLKAHELIKVRVFGDDREQRSAYMDRICGALDAAPVQQIGKLLVVWRPRPPKAKGANRRADGAPARKGAAPRETVLVKPSRTGRRPAVRTRATVLGNQRVTAGGLIKKAKPKQKSVKRRGSD